MLREVEQTRGKPSQVVSYRFTKIHAQYVSKATLVLSFFPSPPNSLIKVSLCHLFPAREVTSGDFGIDLNSRIGRDEVILK